LSHRNLDLLDNTARLKVTFNIFFSGLEVETSNEDGELIRVAVLVLGLLGVLAVAIIVFREAITVTGSFPGFVIVIVLTNSVGPHTLPLPTYHRFFVK
jgi:hypothetical protein